MYSLETDPRSQKSTVGVFFTCVICGTVEEVQVPREEGLPPKIYWECLTCLMRATATEERAHVKESMANRNPGLSKNTERVLTWAAQAQERDDTVRELWKALCDRFDVSTAATGEEVLRLLRKAGSPDVADIFRDEPAPYPEVCWHTAEKLRPMFDDTECTEEDILACEKYVLKRMGISEDDFETLCSAIAVSAARMARKEAAEKTMHEASKTVAAEVENQVAKLVLAEILIAVDIALAELTLIGITVPAYRKAIPGVIYVALLRKLHAAESAFRASPVNKPMKRTPEDPSYPNSALPS